MVVGVLLDVDVFGVAQMKLRFIIQMKRSWTQGPLVHISLVMLKGLRGIDFIVQLIALELLSQEMQSF